MIRHDPRTGATTVAVPSRTAGLGHTRGILPERGGASLLITGEGSNQLLRFDLATGGVTVLNASLEQPTGLDYAPDGDLLVVEIDKVSRLDAATGARKGVFVTAGSGGLSSGTYAAVIAFAAPPVVAVPVVEYYNAALDHYFMSSLAADIAALDSGALKGWARTGLAFNAFPQAVAGANPVCRFYLPPANGDSHFYSASPAECARGAHEVSDVRVRGGRRDARGAARRDHGGLSSRVPSRCSGSGTIARTRIIATRPIASVKAAMLAKGYVAEGYGPDATIMCAPA